MDLTPKILAGRFFDLEPIAEAHGEGPAADATNYVPTGSASGYGEWFDLSFKARVRAYMDKGP